MNGGGFSCRPQLTIATAIMFCHRFFMRQSYAEQDRYVRMPFCAWCLFSTGIFIFNTLLLRWHCRARSRFPSCQLAGASLQLDCLQRSVSRVHQSWTLVQVIASTCLFLAGKVEDTPRQLKDVIYITYIIRHKKDKGAEDRIKQSRVGCPLLLIHLAALCSVSFARRTTRNLCIQSSTSRSLTCCWLVLASPAARWRTLLVGSRCSCPPAPPSGPLG